MNYDCMLYIPFKQQFMVFGSDSVDERNSIWCIDVSHNIMNGPTDKQWTNKLQVGDWIMVYNEERFEWKSKKITRIENKKIWMNEQWEFCGKDNDRIAPYTRNQYKYKVELPIKYKTLNDG